jgi:hypothetical protein
MELDSLLDHIIELRDGGDRNRYDSDFGYRWALHRGWIAVGNEARSYTLAAGLIGRAAQPWTWLYEQRNELAHNRLPDIDEDNVWRATVMRAEQQVKPAVRASLR